MAVLKTCLIGAGVFGGYHASKIDASDSAEFIGIFDRAGDRSAALAQKFGTVAFSSQSDALSASDAVIVACPATFHEQVVSEALARGLHVMVEKPLALSGIAAMDLASRAEAAGVVLQVGHQERFVLEAMGLFDLPESPTRLEAVRASPPASYGRAGDVSVIWDLMIHDLDIVSKLIGTQADVRSTGRRVNSKHLDEVRVELEFEDAIASLMSSRASQTRERRMSLTYPSGSIHIDFLERSVKNSTPYEIREDVSERIPDPLGVADQAFFDACLGKRPCAIPGREAAYAVAYAERAEQLALQPAGA